MGYLFQKGVKCVPQRYLWVYVNQFAQLKFLTFFNEHISFKSIYIKSRLKYPTIWVNSFSSKQSVFPAGTFQSQMCTTRNIANGVWNTIKCVLLNKLCMEKYAAIKFSNSEVTFTNEAMSELFWVGKPASGDRHQES